VTAGERARRVSTGPTITTHGFLLTRIQRQRERFRAVTM
jgi:hypothetical protein